MAPQAGRTLRVTVLDVNGDTSTVTVPEVSSTKALTVAVTAAGAGTVEVPADPTPTASPAPSPGPSPAPPTIPTPAPSAAPGPTAAPADRIAPKLKIKVKRAGKRFRVTVKATDASGVKRISFRLGRKGRVKTYRKPLLVRAKDLRRLRLRAEDKAGNRSKEFTVKRPR